MCVPVDSSRHHMGCTYTSERLWDTNLSRKAKRTVSCVAFKHCSVYIWIKGEKLNEFLCGIKTWKYSLSDSKHTLLILCKRYSNELITSKKSVCLKMYSFISLISLSVSLTATFAWVFVWIYGGEGSMAMKEIALQPESCWFRRQANPASVPLSRILMQNPSGKNTQLR